MLAKKSSLRDYKSSFRWNDLVMGIKKKRQIPSMWNVTTDQELPCHLLHWGWQWTQRNTSEIYLRREQFSPSMQFEINNFIQFFFFNFVSCTEPGEATDFMRWRPPNPSWKQPTYAGEQAQGSPPDGNSVFWWLKANPKVQAHPALLQAPNYGLICGHSSCMVLKKTGKDEINSSSFPQVRNPYGMAAGLRAFINTYDSPSYKLIVYFYCLPHGHF